MLQGNSIKKPETCAKVSTIGILFALKPILIDTYIVSQFTCIWFNMLCE
jgi:hypothetical protein